MCVYVCILVVWLCLQREDMVLTVPNVLTLSRMLLTPFLGYLVLVESYTLACIVFTVAGITDLVIVAIFRHFVFHFSCEHLLSLLLINRAAIRLKNFIAINRTIKIFNRNYS